jgi:hypothetical protein
MAVDRYPGSRSIPRYMQRAGDVLNTTSVKFEWFLVEHHFGKLVGKGLFTFSYIPTLSEMYSVNCNVTCCMETYLY